MHHVFVAGLYEAGLEVEDLASYRKNGHQSSLFKIPLSARVLRAIRAQKLQMGTKPSKKADFGHENRAHSHQKRDF